MEAMNDGPEIGDEQEIGIVSHLIFKVCRGSWTSLVLGAGCELPTEDMHAVGICTIGCRQVQSSHAVGICTMSPIGTMSPSKSP